MTQPEVLIQVLEIIKNSRKFCLVHHTFSSEVVRRFILNKLCKPTALVCVEILVWPCCFTCLIEFSNYTDNRTITTLLENLLWSWTWVILLCVVQLFCKSPAMKLGLCNFPRGHFLCCCFFPLLLSSWIFRGWVRFSCQSSCRVLSGCCKVSVGLNAQMQFFKIIFVSVYVSFCHFTLIYI